MSKQLRKCRDDTRDDADSLISIFALQEIEPYRELTISDIEEDDIIGAMGRDVFQDGIDQLSMRIEESDTFPIFDIVGDEVREKGRFTGTCLTDDIDMSKLIFFDHAEVDPIVTIISRSDHCKLVFGSIGTSREGIGVGELAIDGIVESFAEVLLGREMEKMYCLTTHHATVFGSG